MKDVLKVAAVAAVILLLNAIPFPAWSMHVDGEGNRILPTPQPKQDYSRTEIWTVERGLNCREGWTQPNLRFDDYDLFYVLPERKQADADGYLAMNADHPIGTWYLFRWPDETEYRRMYVASRRQAAHQAGHDRAWAGLPWLAEVDEITWGYRDRGAAAWGILCEMPDIEKPPNVLTRAAVPFTAAGE